MVIFLYITVNSLSNTVTLHQLRYYKYNNNIKKIIFPQYCLTAPRVFFIFHTFQYLMVCLR